MDHRPLYLKLNITTAQGAVQCFATSIGVPRPFVLEKGKPVRIRFDSRDMLAPTQPSFEVLASISVGGVNLEYRQRNSTDNMPSFLVDGLFLPSTDIDSEALSPLRGELASGSFRIWNLNRIRGLLTKLWPDQSTPAYSLILGARRTFLRLVTNSERNTFRLLELSEANQQSQTWLFREQSGDLPPIPNQKLESPKDRLAAAAAEIEGLLKDLSLKQQFKVEALTADFEYRYIVSDGQVKETLRGGLRIGLGTSSWEPVQTKNLDRGKWQLSGKQNPSSPLHKFIWEAGKARTELVSGESLTFVGAVPDASGQSEPQSQDGFAWGLVVSVEPHALTWCQLPAAQPKKLAPGFLTWITSPQSGSEWVHILEATPDTHIITLDGNAKEMVLNCSGIRTFSPPLHIQASGQASGRDLPGPISQRFLESQGRLAFQSLPAGPITLNLASKELIASDSAPVIAWGTIEKNPALVDRTSRSGRNLHRADQPSKPLRDPNSGLRAWALTKFAFVAGLPVRFQPIEKLDLPAVGVRALLPWSDWISDQDKKDTTRLYYRNLVLETDELALASADDPSAGLGGADADRAVRPRFSVTSTGTKVLNWLPGCAVGATVNFQDNPATLLPQASLNIPALDTQTLSVEKPSLWFAAGIEQVQLQDLPPRVKLAKLIGQSGRSSQNAWAPMLLDGNRTYDNLGVIRSNEVVRRGDWSVETLFVPELTSDEETDDSKYLTIQSISYSSGRDLIDGLSFFCHELKLKDGIPWNDPLERVHPGVYAFYSRDGFEGTAVEGWPQIYGCPVYPSGIAKLVEIPKGFLLELKAVLVNPRCVSQDSSKAEALSGALHSMAQGAYLTLTLECPETGPADLTIECPVSERLLKRPRGLRAAKKFQLTSVKAGRQAFIQSNQNNVVAPRQTQGILAQSLPSATILNKEEKLLIGNNQEVKVPKGSDLPSTLTFLESELRKYGITVGMTDGKVLFQRRQLDTETFGLTLGSGLAEQLGFASETNSSVAQPARRSTQLPLHETLTFTYTVRELDKDRKLKFSIHLNAQTPLEAAVVTCNQEFAKKTVPLELTLLPDSTFKLSILEVGSHRSVPIEFSSNQVGATSTGLAAVVKQPYNLADVGPELAGQAGTDASAVLDGKAVESTGNILIFDDLCLEVSGELQTIDLSFKPIELLINGSFDWLLAPEPDPQRGFPAHVARIRGSVVSDGPGQLKLIAGEEPGAVSAAGALHSLEAWPELLSTARPELGRFGFSSRPSKPQSAMDAYCATGFIPAGARWVPVLPLRSDLASVPPLTAAYSGQSVSVFLLEAGDHDPVTCTFPQPLQDLILVVDQEPMLPGTSRQQAQTWLLGQQGDSLLLLRLGSEEEECSVVLPGLERWYPSHQEAQEDQEAGLRLLVVRTEDGKRLVEVRRFQDLDGKLRDVLEQRAEIAFAVEAIGSGNPSKSVYLANTSHEIVEWQWDQGPSAAIPTKVGTIHSVLVQQELVVAVGDSGAQFISSAKAPTDPINFAGLLSARWCGPGEIVLAGSQKLVRVHHSDSESEIENLVQLNAPLATFAGVFHLEDGLALAGGGADAIDVWMAEDCLVVSERELSCDLGLTTKLSIGNSEPKRELRLDVTGGHGLRASLHWQEGQADQRWSAHARIIQGAYHCFQLARNWQTVAGASGAVVFWVESGGTQGQHPKLGACLLIEHLYSKQGAKFNGQTLSGPQVRLKIITSSKEKTWIERDLTTWLLENDSQAKERIRLMLHEQSLPAEFEEPRVVVSSLSWSDLEQFEVQGTLLLKASWNAGGWSFTSQDSVYAAVPVLPPPPTTDAEFLVDLGIPVLGGAPQLFDLVSATLDTNRTQTWLRAGSQVAPFPTFVPIASVGLDRLADSQVSGLGQKLPISVPSLVHRRIFGARLRAEVPPNSSVTVGDQDHPYVVLGDEADTANSVYSIVDLYYGKSDEETRRRRVLGVADATRLFSKERNQPGNIFNTRLNWRPLLPNLFLDVGDQLLIPPVNAASWVRKGNWLLCPLTALPGSGGLAVINEALWARTSTVNDSSIRSENLLSLQRLAPKPVGSDPDLPSLSCVISLTTPGIEPILKDEDCRSWLLRSGAAGVALLRSLSSTRTKSLPASYRFIPSPFFERPNEVSLTAPDVSFSQIPTVAGKPVGQLARDARCLEPSPSLARLRADTSGGFHFETANWSPWDDKSGELASTLLRVARLRVADLKAWRKGQASLVAFEAPAYEGHASLWQIPPAPVPTDKATFMPAKIETRYSADKAGAMTHHKLQPVLSASDTVRLGTHHEFAMRDPMQFQPPRGASIQFIDPPKATRLPPDPIPPGFAQLNLTWKEVLGELPVDLKLEAPFTYTGAADKWPEPDQFRLNEARLFMLVAVVGDEIIEVGPELPYVPCDEAPKLYLISQIDILEPQVLNIGGKDGLFEARFNGVTATNEQFLLVKTELGEPWRVWQIVLPSRPPTFKMNWCFSQATTQLPPPTDVQIAEIEKRLVFLKERPIRLIPTLTAPKFAAVLSGIGTVNKMRQYERTLLFGRAADPDSGTPELTNAQKFVYSRTDRETPLIHLPEPEEPIAYHLAILKYLTNGQVLFRNMALKTE